MTVKELIAELQHLAYEMPNGVSTEVCIEIGTPDDETERHSPECYIDEDDDSIVISY